MTVSKTTQENRTLYLDTPLGKDFLLLNKFTAVEKISGMFHIEAQLLHAEDEEGHEPTDIDPSEILGKAVTITVTQRDGTSRTFNGMVNSFSKGNRNARFSFYDVTIVPHVWLLTQKFQSRIFQHKTIPQILEEVFKGFEFSNEIQGTFKPRNYCVQYQESDFDFACRLMEEEGIYYYFEHTESKHKMILANTTQSHQDAPSKNIINYNISLETDEGFIPRINDLKIGYRLQSGKITNRDYTFQLPTNNLESQQPSLYTIGDNQKLEIYNHPGGYARKVDGIDKMGGEDSSNLQNVFDDKQRVTETMMNALDSQYNVLIGESNCCSLTAGHRFGLQKHPNNKLNAQYVITEIKHEAVQNPSYISEAEEETPYENEFNCIPHGQGTPLYCPPQVTPKPTIQGAQTAVVVGPGGEEIFTDKYGRVKVQFNWDRHGQNDADSSCWVRVAQVWASSGWGSMFIPRIGMEVIVHFINGDPDQPIITGCVYNPETMPAYTLPDEKTKSGIKSNSSQGGDGFNEFRIEDKKGEEQIFIHGEKDLDVRIKNDAKEIIKNDRHLIVEENQFEKVGADKHLKVNGDKNEEVTGTVSEKAQNMQLKATQNYAIDGTSEVHIKGGQNVVIESNTSLTLKVGSSFVSLSPANVSISGQMVNINSGGMAGSGMGSNPTAPTEPQEADDAVAGQVAGSRTPSPPPPPTEFTPLAQSISDAANKGIPFVDYA